MILRLAAVAISIVFASEIVFASDVCDSFRRPHKIETQLRNCERIVREGLIPNRRALKYTINYMNENHGKLRDAKCAEDGKRANDLCTKCTDNSFIEKGIDNNCTFVINDLKKPWTKKGEAFAGRTTAYFVNLCPAPNEKLVEPFYINGGKGKLGDDRPTENLDTAPSNSSTLAGAFMLSSDLTFDFVPGHPENYAKISETFGGSATQPRVPAIRMIGLNSSNNTTEFDKPLHVSAYSRGLGCAGVNISTFPIMEKIVAQGSSLYMAYAGPEFEQKGSSCRNDTSDDGPNSPVSGSRSAASTVDLLNSRYVFDVTGSESGIKKLQVDIVKEDSFTIAKTKYLTDKGEKGNVRLVCFKLGGDGLNCRRGDNGGSFDLFVQPKPRLNFARFTASHEDVGEKDPLAVNASDHKVVVVEGKKATFTKADAF